MGEMTEEVWKQAYRYYVDSAPFREMKLNEDGRLKNSDEELKKMDLEIKELEIKRAAVNENMDAVEQELKDALYQIEINSATAEHQRISAMNSRTSSIAEATKNASRYA